MTLPTTTLTGRLINQSGTPAAGLSVRLILDRTDSDGQATVHAKEQRAVSDTDGQFELAVWPNARGSAGSRYKVTIRRGGELLIEGRATVPESAEPVDLFDLIDAVSAP